MAGLSGVREELCSRLMIGEPAAWSTVIGSRPCKVTDTARDGVLRAGMFIVAEVNRRLDLGRKILGGDSSS